MGKEKPGDSDPDTHTDGKQETGKMGKSQYREAHGGCSIYLQQGKNRFWWFRNSFLSIQSEPDLNMLSAKSYSRKKNSYLWLCKTEREHQASFTCTNFYLPFSEKVTN